MVKSVRFLLQFIWVNLLALLGFGAVIIAGCYITGVIDGAENLFGTYFSSFPIMVVYMLYIFAFTMCTTNLNLGLAMGAKRRDFFWAVQVTALVYAGLCWMIQVVMAKVPALGHWSTMEHWESLLWINGDRLWIYPLINLAVVVLGCVSGLAFSKSKVLGGIMIAIAALILMFGVILMAVMSNRDLKEFLMESAYGGLWGDLPMVLAVITGLAFVGSEAILWRYIHRYMVR